jgi:hypothetical protein
MSNWNWVMYGVAPSGKIVPVQVDAAGNIGSGSAQSSPVVTRLGGINPSSSDFLIGLQFVRRIYASNTTAIALFVQYHNKVAALVLGDVPVLGEIYSLPAISGSDAGILLLSASDLLPNGLNCGSNMRVAISSTRNTYTPAAMAGVNLNIEMTT